MPTLSPMFMDAIWICPPISAVTAGACPAKGRWFNRTPAAFSNAIISRWSSEPIPAVPTAMVPGAARAAPIRSARLRHGLFGATKKPPGSSTTVPRKAKSRSE